MVDRGATQPAACAVTAHAAGRYEWAAIGAEGDAGGLRRDGIAVRMKRGFRHELMRPPGIVRTLR